MGHPASAPPSPKPSAARALSSPSPISTFGRPPARRRLAGLIAVERRFPRLDVLVNSFGIMHVGRIHETSVDDYDRVQSVNARGFFLCAKAAIEIMCRQGHGNIINLASVAGLIAVELSRALAIDYARENIRVNAICPGTVDTPMIRNYVAAHFGDRIEETIAELHARQPVGRMGTADEIAALAVYLASDESRYLTGAALPIDGGWTAK